MSLANIFLFIARFQGAERAIDIHSTIFRDGHRSIGRREQPRVPHVELWLRGIVILKRIR